MKSYKLETTLCFSVGRSTQIERQVIVTYGYSPAARDYWARNPGVWLPGDPAEVEIEDMIDKETLARLPDWLQRALASDNEFLGYIAEEAAEAERDRQAEAMESAAERRAERDE